MNSPDSDNLIRISKDDALSPHVDDLLKRQMNMRGDPGVTRDRHHVWFYQNWFVLAVAGMLGAVTAWAMLEPVFDDFLYIQGNITSVTDPADMPDLAGALGDKSNLQDACVGMVTVNGENILLLHETKEINEDESVGLLTPRAFKPGEEAGFYVEYYENAGGHVSVATFAVKSPAPRPPGQAVRTLHQLASRKSAVGLLLFPAVAGLIGLFIGAADGLVCRLTRRALLCGAVGLLVGFVGGFISSFIGDIVYGPLNHLAQRTEAAGGGLATVGFVLQVIGRSLAWCLAGSTMGLAQGIALRSNRLLVYGLLGGVIGGLLGGLLFDPIDVILLGPDKPSAAWSRLIGFAVIGLSVGGMIGIVELLARDAWLRMTQGPLTGKEFMIFKDVMSVGSSPRSDIYLFNDPQVAEQHAILRAVGDECEIEARQSTSPVLLNNRSVTRGRLRHGDNVTIGRTSFIFQQRKG
jgi:hypothetical protein